jgi:hypothetical protein
VTSVDPGILQAALAKALTDSVSGEVQSAVLKEAMWAYLFTPRRLNAYDNKETTPLSAAFEKALDAVTRKAVEEVLSEPAHTLLRHVSAAPLRVPPLHVDVGAVQTGLVGQSSECPRCGAVGRVVATCAEFHSQPGDPNFEGFQETIKRIHARAARGAHTHLRCVHADCGLVTIGLGKDAFSRVMGAGL